MMPQQWVFADLPMGLLRLLGVEPMGLATLVSEMFLGSSWQWKVAAVKMREAPVKGGAVPVVVEFYDGDNFRVPATSFVGWFLPLRS